MKRAPAGLGGRCFSSGAFGEDEGELRSTELQGTANMGESTAHRGRDPGGGSQALEREGGNAYHLRHCCVQPSTELWSREEVALSPSQHEQTEASGLRSQCLSDPPATPTPISPSISALD